MSARQIFFPFLDLDAVRKNLSLGTSPPSHKVRKKKKDRSYNT